MAMLDTIANRHAQWSETANQLKSTIDRARWSVFALSSLGAVLAAVASQLPDNTTAPRTTVAIAGAVSLAIATFFTQRLLGADRISSWVRARAISERLKREAYRFAASAAPYDDAAKADALLDDEGRKIEADGEDLLPQLVQAAGQGSLPRQGLQQQQYITQRVQGHIGWFTKRAARYQVIASRLRHVEFALAALATLLTAVAGVEAKPVIAGVPFDMVAFTAVLTTLGGAVLAHVEASRYDFLVTTYRATARRLEDCTNRPRPSWSDFVNECENILATENMSWIAKFTGKPGTTSSP
ncbi:DUF4231 domain-containing protein [Bradyrhizobium sp. B120]|uniref:DUF4231 domain-containing protein n=1 Tax=Bradyrhizobium sp. B120 TaxID=3410088 RepID=UPI003B982F94